MPAFSVNCPECRASLKSSKQIPPGTPLECPKCQVMFAAPAPKRSFQPRHRDEIEVIEDVEVIDEIDDVEIVDDDEPVRPAARRQGARQAPNARRRSAPVEVEIVDDDDDLPRRPFKAKRKKGAGKPYLIGFGILAGLLLLGGLAVLGYWLFSTGTDDPLTYMPADCDVIVGADGAALLNSQFGSKIEELLNSDDFKQMTKYKQDMKCGNKDLYQKIAFGVKSGGGGKPVLAVKSSLAWDDAKLAAAFDNTTKTTVGGKTFYYHKQGGFGPRAIGTPHRNVAIFTDRQDAELEPIAKAKALAITGDLATVLGKVSKNNAFLAVHGSAASGKGTASPFGPMVNLNGPAMQGIKAVAIGGTLGGTDIDVKGYILMTDDSAAQKASTEMKGEFDKALTAAKAFSAMAPPSVKTLIDDISGSIKFNNEGSLVVLTCKVKISTMDYLLTELAARRNAQPTQPPAGQPNQQPPRGRGARG